MRARPTQLDEVLAADAILAGGGATPFRATNLNLDLFDQWKPFPLESALKFMSELPDEGSTSCELGILGYTSILKMHGALSLPTHVTQTIDTGAVTPDVVSVTTPSIVDIAHCAGHGRVLGIFQPEEAVGRRLSVLKPVSKRPLVDKSAFLTRDRFFVLLAERRPFLTDDQYNGLATQLRQLLADEMELEELKITPSVLSFRALTKFLSSHQTAHPSLSLTMDGLFAASWSPSRSSKLTLTFKNLSDGSWVGINLDAPIKRGSGQFTLDQFVLPEPFANWI